MDHQYQTTFLPRHTKGHGFSSERPTLANIIDQAPIDESRSNRTGWQTAPAVYARKPPTMQIEPHNRIASSGMHRTRPALTPQSLPRLHDSLKKNRMYSPAVQNQKPAFPIPNALRAANGLGRASTLISRYRQAAPSRPSITQPLPRAREHPAQAFRSAETSTFQYRGVVDRRNQLKRHHSVVSPHEYSAEYRSLSARAAAMKNHWIRLPSPKKKRGSYKCRRCGGAKKDHKCTANPSFVSQGQQCDLLITRDNLRPRTAFKVLISRPRPPVTEDKENLHQSTASESVPTPEVASPEPQGTSTFCS